jgi:hypothetical protein
MGAPSGHEYLARGFGIIKNLADAQRLVMWPKLFRRLVSSQLRFQPEDLLITPDPSLSVK